MTAALRDLEATGAVGKLEPSLAQRLVDSITKNALDDALTASQIAALAAAKLMLLPPEIKENEDQLAKLLAEGSHRVQEMAYGYQMQQAAALLLQEATKEEILREVQAMVDEELWHLAKIPVLSCIVPGVIAEAIATVRRARERARESERAQV